MVILQFFPEFTPPDTLPVVAGLPLFVIVTLTLIKDGFEDRARHKADNQVNNHHCWRLASRNSGEVSVFSSCHLDVGDYLGSDDEDEDAITHNNDVTIKIEDEDNKKLSNIVRRISTRQSRKEGDRHVWKQTTWKEIVPGDIILIRDDELVPADLLIISTSEKRGLCYVETKNLDGETNLKVKSCVQGLNKFKTPQECSQLNGKLETEKPTPHMYTLNGKGHVQSSDGIDVRFPISINQVLLRGCALRNTKWVVGVVMLTGSETKLMLNSGEATSKRSKIERIMIPQILINFVILGILCIMCAVMSRLYVGSFRNIVHPNEGIPPNRTLPTRADYGRLAFFYFDDHFWNRTADHGGGSNPQSSAEYESFTIFANCLILFQNIIPIAIFISVDVAKIFYQSYMIRVDEEMYDAETEQYALPRSWNLCDDLGQIEYVFSDKTGTLTSNDMVFRKCTINGVVYGDSYISEALVGARIKAASSAAREKDLLDQKLLDRAQEEICMRETMDSLFNTQFVSKNGMLPFVDSTLHKHVVEGLDVVNNTKDNDEAGAEVDYSDYSIPGSKIANQSTAIIEFFTLLAVCHTVLLDDPVSEDCPSPSIKYKAQSPDEAALVSAAKDVGFTFLKREDNRVTVDILGTQKVFYILHVLEFNSDRKRMSVIVRKEGDEQVVLLCKGADTVVFERLHSNNDASLLRMTEQHLETFANDGLRTLCLAYKIISDSEYIPWAKQYKEVQLLVDNREEELDRLASGIENGFSLMGATAIEDKLQEGVPESIETLAKAGIKLWVLTGDKMETAINIGYASNLLTRNMLLIIIKSSSSVQNTRKQIVDALRMFWAPNGEKIRKEDLALVIDGESLKWALSNECKAHLLELACRCKVVICCRVSPLQKADVVTLVRTGLGAMCLAIGDGANDVSMIQKADIGIGIRGKEGLQAVMSSDYSISQFRFLTRLLLVHGRWSYIRTSQLILNFFYKNVVMLFVLFWFQFFSAFSAAIVMDNMYVMLFNTIFSIFPNMVVGTFDQDINDRISMKVPQLYRIGIQQQLYNTEQFWFYIAEAIYQSVVCFFASMALFRGNFMEGVSLDQAELGSLIAFSCVFICNIFMACNNHSWNIFTHLCLYMTLSMFTIFSIFYDRSENNPSLLKGTIWHILGDRSFYATMVLIIVVGLLPRLIYKFVQQTLFPSDMDLVKEYQKYVWKEGDAVDLSNLDDLHIDGFHSPTSKKHHQQQRGKGKKVPTSPVVSSDESSSDFCSSSVIGTAPPGKNKSKRISPHLDVIQHHRLTEKRRSLAEAPINPGGVAFRVPSYGRRPYVVSTDEDENSDAAAQLDESSCAENATSGSRRRAASFGTQRSTLKHLGKKTSEFVKSIPRRLRISSTIPSWRTRFKKNRPLILMDSHQEVGNTGFAFDHSEGLERRLTDKNDSEDH